MKMGLTLVLVGHVNFLLGALVHGAVLRYFIVKIKIRTLIYAVSNVIAIVEGLIVRWFTHTEVFSFVFVIKSFAAGSKLVVFMSGMMFLLPFLQGIISGIVAIVLSKNKKNKTLVNTFPLSLPHLLSPPSAHKCYTHMDIIVDTPLLKLQ